MAQTQHSCHRTQSSRRAGCLSWSASRSWDADQSATGRIVPAQARGLAAEVSVIGAAGLSQLNCRAQMPRNSLKLLSLDP